MKRGKGLGVVFLFLILGIIGVVSASTATITINGSQRDQIVNQIISMYGFPTSDQSYYPKGIDSTYQTATRDRLCYMVNYTNDPTVSNKLILSATYTGGIIDYYDAVHVQSNAFFSGTTGENLIYWNGTAWKYVNAGSSSCNNACWMKWNPYSATITCSVTYTDHCTNTCSPLGSKRCNGNIAETCGDYNTDGCLEWGNSANCVPGICEGSGVCNYGSGCSPDQTIMKLSNSLNSHGALWNDTSYTYDVCYSEIFKENYTGANPHSCNGNNNLINLFSNTNSHGEVIGLNNYNTPVCYGDLQCRNALSCAADENIVVRLSNTTNAHISNASDTNSPIQICCKNNVQTTNGTNWTNMDDEIIYKADLGDSVKLMIFGEGIKDKNVNYTIYKEGAYWWNRDKVVAQTSTKGFLIWKAEPNGTYYFEAKIEGESDWKKSNNLLVSTTQNNSMPTIILVKPAPETNYIINQTTKKTASIDFEQISHDEDDDLNIFWNFGDGYGLRFSNCNGNNCNTTYKYNQSGTKMVTVTADETERWQNATDASEIFIYQKGLNIFAIIDDPYYKDVPQTIGTFLINGTSSHVANCTFNSSECSNTADNYVPERTCYEVIDNKTSDKIYCYKFADSGTPGFGFQWRINGDIDEEHTNLKYFYKTFSIPRRNQISLKVNFTF